MEKITHEIDVVIGIIKRGGRYFIQRRPAKGLLAGLWEFPGGKLEQGERPEAALRRELKEELNVDIDGADFFTRVRHFYTKYRVNLHAYFCSVSELPAASLQRRWIRLNEFSDYPMPSGTAKIVSCLKSQLPINP